ncbi:SRPBCC family protein [Arsenicicoccus piscis]|uniref:Polyketide cyclase n=1 Tax=Arsenicicoccus piscis TaxID=673954 RepID=A0ABQ6HW49_9MICO|nr:SRPBCC family protein [Arsenicicoccus piscis]GMA21795.1 hypothetical protein GCM10025862_38160 [Arsenicicoccus piscis]
MRSAHIGVVVQRPVHEVYAFAREPDNLPRWASGLAGSEVRRVGAALVTDSPMGEVRFAFVAPNDLGVLNHDVTLPTGDVVTNPMRVVAHPDGSEVLFTVRQQDLTDEEFARDCATVERDLLRLKEILEAEGYGCEPPARPGR